MPKATFWRFEGRRLGVALAAICPEKAVFCIPVVYILWFFELLFMPLSLSSAKFVGWFGFFVCKENRMAGALNIVNEVRGRLSCRFVIARLIRFRYMSGGCRTEKYPTVVIA